MKAINFTINFLIVTVLSLVFTAMAFAQATIPEMSDSEFVILLIQSLGGLKGLGASGIALLVGKLLLQALNTPTFGKQLDRMLGKWKLLFTLVLQYAVGVITLVVSGVPLVTALVHSSVIALLGLLINQVYKQFVEKADEPAKIHK